MSVIQGAGVTIEFYKATDYFGYLCAETIDINFTVETKSVKTVGDGSWGRRRGQKKDHSIDVGGLISYGNNSATSNIAWDILDYLLAMTDVQYKIVYRDDNGNIVKVIWGTALPTDQTFSGPMDFAGSSFTLIGNGPPTVANSFTMCISTVGSVSLASQSALAINFDYSGVTGTPDMPARLEWYIDGGTRMTIFSPGASGTITATGARAAIPAGSHTLYVIPVCDNGFDGTVYTLIFTRT